MSVDFNPAKHQQDIQYYTSQQPIDLRTENVNVNKKYFYTSGPGDRAGVVTILSDELQYGINVEFERNESQDIISENDLGQKNLYHLKEGGNNRYKSRKNRRKSKKTRISRKNRRKSKRRYRR